ncbi:MAG: hypothetical protein HZA36_03810 [Parcubacteria group bacterium]|nr:hypothetical protein [Parcubacteria group bacterium]
MDMLAGWLKSLSGMARAAVVLLATVLLVTPFVAAVMALAGGSAVAAWGTLAQVVHLSSCRRWQSLPSTSTFLARLEKPFLTISKKTQLLSSEQLFIFYKISYSTQLLSYNDTAL